MRLDGTDLLAKIRAVFAANLDIHNEGIDGMFAGEREQLLRIRGGRDLIALVLKKHFEDIANPFFVVDNCYVASHARDDTTSTSRFDSDRSRLDYCDGDEDHPGTQGC